MAAALSLAVLALTGLGVSDLDTARRHEAMLAVASTVSWRLDATLEHDRTAAKVLARSHALTISGDLEIFRIEAEQIADLIGGWVVLARDGPELDLVMTTLLPADAPLPPPEARSEGYAEVFEAERRSRASGRPEFSDVFIGRVVEGPVITVATPLRGAGRNLMLYLSQNALSLSEGLFETALPREYATFVFDGKGRIVAHSKPDEAPLLQHAPAWAAEALRGRDRWVGASPQRGGDEYTSAALVRPESVPAWTVMVARVAPPAPPSTALLFAPVAAGIATLLLYIGGIYVFRRMQQLTAKVASEDLRVEELGRTLDAARDADAVKDRLMALLVHELRMPLTGMLGAIGQLGGSPDAAQSDRALRLTRKSGEDMLQLIDDVLERVPVGAGQLQLRPIRFDPGRLLRDVAEISAPNAMMLGNRITVDVPDALPDLIGDDRRIRRILLNLTANALKFTQGGKVGLSISLTGTSGRTVGVVFAVSDTGIGIAPEDLPRLFKAYTRLERSRHLSPLGLGLGLHLCQQLAQAMGGEITVDGRLDEGSTFRLALELPMAPDVSEGRDEIDAK